MPSTETYSISGDFPAGRVRGHVLQKQIQDEDAISTAVQSVSTAGDDCSIVFAAALSGPEKTALDAVVAAHDPGNGIIPAKNFLKRVFHEGTTLPETEEWYASHDAGAGTFSGLAERTSYSYSETHALLDRTVTTYTSDSIAWTQVKYTYYTASDGARVVKVEELL